MMEQRQQTAQEMLQSSALIWIDYDQLPEQIKKSRLLKDCKVNTNYDDIKELLTVRLYPLAASGVEESIHKVVNDIALVLYLVLQEEEGMTAGMKVPYPLDKIWGIPEDILVENTLIREAERIEPRILNRMDILNHPEDYEGQSLDEVESLSAAMTPCLTTNRKLNGSIAAFLPGVAKRIGDLFDSDYYLVFTSIHEVMLHPIETIAPEDLQSILADTIEKATLPEDFLTHNIYRYYREEDIIQMV